MQGTCAELYCHLWPVRLLHIFPHFLTKFTIFEKKKLSNIKCVFCFSLHVLFETFLIRRLIKRDIIYIYIYMCVCVCVCVCMYVLMWSARYSHQTSIKLEFSQPRFEEFSNIWDHENPSSGPVPCGPTHTQTNVRRDSETDMTKLIVAFVILRKPLKILSITLNNAQREWANTQSSYATETKTVLKYSFDLMTLFYVESLCTFELRDWL